MTLRELVARGLALRGRLVLLLLLALLPAFIVSFYTSWQHRDRLLRDAQESTTRLASIAAAHVEGILDSTYHLLAVLESDPQIRAGGRACEARFEEVLRSAGHDLSALARTDDHGKVVCSSPPPAGRQVPEGKILERMRAGQSFAIREASIGELTGKPVIVAVQAMRDGDRFIGTVATGLYLERFAHLASRTGLPPGAIFSMVNADGTIVARYPAPDRWIGTNVSDRPGFQGYLKDSREPGGFVGPSLDGVVRVWGYAPIQIADARFITLVGLSEDERLQAANAVLINNMIGFGITAVLALAAAAFLGEFVLRRPIERMRLTAERITSGDLAARVALERAPGELGALSRSIDDMAVGLQSREQRLAGLSRRVLEVQELERRALARELHDEIGQSLTALKLMLQRHRQADECRDPSRIDELIQVTDRTLQQVRGLSLDLRPSMLDHLGLAATLRWYVDREAERSGFTAICVIQPERLRLDTSLETTIFRIAQEALTNIARHARATEVAVHLAAADGTVELSVRDNGPGFDVERALEKGRQGASLGLLGMEERAVLAGGTLHLRSGPTGTEVRAVFNGVRL